MSVTLRPYQVQGVADLRAAFASGPGVLYVLATGGGKTVTFTEIARNAAAKGSRIWILVHRQELLHQTSRALHALGLHHGLVAPGHTLDRTALIQVCSIQTLVRRIDRMGPVDLIIVDEAHHATAGTWRTVLAQRPTARVLGVTATPERTDGQGLGRAGGGMFDALVLGPSTADLIADGYLCQPLPYVPPSLLDLSGVHMRGGDFATNEVTQRVDRPTITGDAVDHYRRLCPGAPAIVFCASVAHAQHVAAQFQSAGFRFESLDGTMDDARRKALIDGLGNGRLHGLTSCEIISEGTDIPVVTAAILLRPTASLTLYLQQVGRALRPVYAPGMPLATREDRLAAIAAGIKPRAIILDHVGNVMRHGLPDDARQWTLEGQPKKARGTRDVLPPLPIVQCPKCYAAHKPAPECPNCHHVYVTTVAAPRQVEGELTALTADQINAVRKATVRKQMARARTFEELKALAAQLGYKPGWAQHVWSARQSNQRVMDSFTRSRSFGSQRARLLGPVEG